ncbi:MAG TPA: Uma2 family endonuclease [Bryobacteraceae bacterium]|nr:Uma2 family endonuclease [Bryobacteraceae bacterium]
MAARPLPLSIEEFHKLYDCAKPVYEYWYGKAVRKAMPTALHGVVQCIIMLLLGKAGWNAASEVRLKVIKDVEPVPDVIAVRGKFKGRYPTAAPDLCIEILSPGDTLARALEKAKIYISWGSQCVWIIDPEQRTAWNLTEGAPEAAWIPPDGALRIADTAIEIAAIFAEVDNKMELTDDLQ